MNRSKTKTGLGALKTYGISLVILVGVLVLVLQGLSAAAKASYDEELRMLERSIWKGVVSCYAVEGFYPESVDYLIENYGIRVDDAKFVVHYSIFGSNIMPDIDIREVKS